MKYRHNAGWQKRGKHFKAGQPNTAVLALRLDFIQPPREDNVNNGMGEG